VKEKWVCILLTTSLTVLLLFGMMERQQPRPVFSTGSELPILVLDAGHGGFDGGAVGADGTMEQDINLSIAYRVQALCGLFGYPVQMTRTDEQALDYVEGRSVRENKVADIKARERIVNNVENPVFLSIHLNKFQDPQYYGAQVFYSKNHPGSKILAEKTQEAMIAGIQNGNIRRAKPAVPTIYLMKNLTCPAVIVECGFLSNPEEERKLGDSGYQKRLALCIFEGWKKYSDSIGME
jgi:N-acetylmuramoyl-L-alanine amidase